jgi:hypothetical protein
MQLEFRFEMFTFVNEDEHELIDMRRLFISITQVNQRRRERCQDEEDSPASNS